MSQQDEGFPIVVTLDSLLRQQYPQAETIRQKVEAWINFAALKADWYGSENCVLEFNFKVIPAAAFTEQVKSLVGPSWIIDNDNGFAYYHAKGCFDKSAFIAMDDGQMGVFEQTLKTKLLEVANAIAGDFGLADISG